MGGFGIIDLLLILAVVVVVPFGLFVEGRRFGPGIVPQRGKSQWQLLFFCAALAVIAVVTRSQSEARSWLALALTIPWLALSAVEAGRRFIRWWTLSADQRRWSVDELMRLSAGLCWLTAAIWLTMATLQRPILWFGAQIVLLTAVHFHLAGFATCVLACLRLQASTRLKEERYARIGSWLILIATPTVAFGHMTIGAIQLLGGLFMACGVFALSFCASLQAQRASGPRKALLIVSALAPIAPMALAVHYALNQVTIWHPLSYDTIASIHGLLNAVGFLLPGLAAESGLVRGGVGRGNVAANG